MQYKFFYLRPSEVQNILDEYAKEGWRVERSEWVNEHISLLLYRSLFQAA